MDTENIKSAVSITDDLDKELIRLPSLLWHYGDLEAAAYQKALEADPDD